MLILLRRLIGPRTDDERRLRSARKGGNPAPEQPVRISDRQDLPQHRAKAARLSNRCFNRSSRKATDRARTWPQSRRSSAR